MRFPSIKAVAASIRWQAAYMKQIGAWSGHLEAGETVETCDVRLQVYEDVADLLDD